VRIRPTGRRRANFLLGNRSRVQVRLIPKRHSVFCRLRLRLGSRRPYRHAKGVSEFVMTTNRLSHPAFYCVALALALAGTTGAHAQTVKQAAQTKPTKSVPEVKHKVAIQVNQNDKAVMDLALNNAKNVVDYYKSKGESVAIEIVTYGPGLHMLRADTSPVKDRIGPMSLENSNIAFIACGNTQANHAKAEGRPVALISEAKVMPSGVVRLMELQKQGYAYIRP
jgi:uncharacterized protein